MRAWWIGIRVRASVCNVDYAQWYGDAAHMPCGYARAQEGVSHTYLAPILPPGVPVPVAATAILSVAL